MLYLISYDVSTQTAHGRARLRRVAKACENYGVRVQNSVFECAMDYSVYVQLRGKLTKLINPEEDSLRIYPLGKNGREKIVHIGKERGFDVEGPLVL